MSIVGHYIKERTKNAQFVIISLRNNMFELADRLVGIYKVRRRRGGVGHAGAARQCLLASLPRVPRCLPALHANQPHPSNSPPPLPCPPPPPPAPQTDNATKSVAIDPRAFKVGQPQCGVGGAAPAAAAADKEQLPLPIATA